MNCECKPPQLAVLRTVQKAGANQGKEFFTCPNSSCKFFAWAGGPMPASLHRPAATSVSVGGGGGGGSAAGRSRSFSHFAKVSILSFDFSPTTATTTAAASSSSSSIKAKSSTETGQVVKITCGITTAGNTKLTNYLTSLSTTEMITFFNPSLKLWCFDIQSHNRIISDIKTMEIPSFDIEELPSFLVHGLLNFVNRIRNLKNIYSEDLDIVPNITTSLLTTLMPFQLDGLKFVIQRGGRALIGDEMGCGKTMQAIGLLQHYRNHWPALLIVPVNLVNQWKQEILQYSSELIQLHDICIIKTKKDQITSKKICIIPYTMIDSFQEQDKLTCDQFGMIICDESHNIKSMDAKRTHCVLPLLRACTIAICLSGTPAVNRPVELYTQLNGLLPSVFAAYDQFTKRYCDAKPARYNAAILDVKGSSNESELRLLLENMVMIRRLKADVVKSLPKKSRELRYVEPDATFLPELRRLDNQMKTTEKKLLEASHDSAEMMKLKRDSQQLLLQFYQITGMCKIKAIQKELFHRINEARLARATEDSMPAETNPSSSSSSASPSKASLAVMELEDDVVMQTQTIHHEVHASDVAHHTRDDAPRVMHLEQDMVLESTPPLTVEMAATILSHASLEYKRKKIDPAVEEEDALVDTDEEAAEEAMFNEHQKRKALLRGGSKVKGKREVDSKRVTRKTSAQNNKDHYFEESEGSVYADDDEEEEEDEYGDYEEEEDEEFEEEDVKGKRKSSSSRSNKRRSIGKQSSAKTKKQKSPVDDDVDEDDIIIFEDEELKKQSKDKVVTAAKSLGQKILVFAHHHKVLDAIEEVLRTSEVGYIRVDGSTSQSRKTALIDEFKTQANIDVALLSITACGTGLNLTKANIAIFAELYWSPGIVLQAEDRIHRIGQVSKEVKIIYVLAKGTADNIVWDNIKKKYSTIDATIGNAGGENNLATVGTITAPVTMPSSSSSSSAVPTGQKKMNEFISSSQQVVSTSSNVLNPYATAAATTTNTTKLIQSQLPVVVVNNPYESAYKQKTTATIATVSVSNSSNSSTMPVQTMPTSASSSEPPSQDFQYTVPSQQAPSASITIDIHVSNNTTITSKFRDTSHYEAALRKPNPVANPYATNQVPSSTSQPTVQPNPYQVNANPYVNPAVAPVNTFQNSNPYSVYGAKATNTVPQSQHSTTVPTANSSNNYIANNPYNNPISNPYQKIAQPIQQVVPSHPYNTNLHAAVPSSTNVSTSSNHYAPLAQQHSSNFNPNMVTHPEQSYQYHASTRPPAATNPYTIPQTNQVPTSMGPTTTTSTGTELTPEMLRKIEENRLKALARKAAKSQPSLPLTSNSHETSSAAHSYSSGYNYHASSSVHTNNYPRSPNQHLSHPYGKPQALPSQPPPQQGQTPYGIQQQYATHPTNSNTLPFNTARGNNLQVSDSALQHGYNMFPTGNPPPAPNQN